MIPKKHVIERQLLELNPYLRGKKIFLQGVNENTLEIFGALTWYGHYVEGFVDEGLSGKKILNKKVFSVNEIEKIEEKVVINELCTDYGILDKDSSATEQAAFVINRTIDVDNIILVGYGKMGRATKNFLEKHGIKVKYILDSNYYDSNDEDNVDGMSVKNVSFLKNVDRNASIVIASGAYFEELYRLALNYINADRLFYCGEIFSGDGSTMPIYDLKEEAMTYQYLSIQIVAELVPFISDKKIFLYQNSELSGKFKDFLELLDYNDITFIEVNSKSENILSIEDVLYYPESVIIFDSKKNVPLRKMTELNLIRGKDYLILEAFFSGSSFYARKNVMDLYLGQSYIGNYNVSGFTEIGDYYNAEIKIVLLGGSTTDETLYEFTSWGSYLYEKTDGLAGILNGGVAGYNTSQELLKLLRDVIRLKPDVVICYDGFNNTYNDYCDEFPSSYMRTIFGYVRDYFIENDTWRVDWGEKPDSIDEMVTGGKRFDGDYFEQWYRHVRMMNAIANEFGIKIYFFLQPFLYTKKNYSKDEKILSYLKCRKSQVDRLQSIYKGFNDNKLYEKQNMYCLSDIFDNEKGTIYMDECHVNERGNEIIAEEIFKRIPELQIIKQRGNI